MSKDMITVWVLLALTGLIIIVFSNQISHLQDRVATLEETQQ